VATIFPEGVSYWELLDATKLTEGDTLGDQIQNMLA
jgi:hypothetical protein